MSSWNYRIIRHTPKDEEEYFAIHEVFYNDKNEPHLCTQSPINVLGDTYESIKWQLSKMQDAMDKPIIDYQFFLDREVDEKNEVKNN